MCWAVPQPETLRFCKPGKGPAHLAGAVMSGDDQFSVRPGRIADRRGGAGRTFVGEALAAAQRAGGLAGPRTSGKGAFGRGRAASLAAGRGLNPALRGAVVKARVVRSGHRPGGLGLHLKYLQREGVTKDGERGAMFDAAGDSADPGAFAERCVEDRHHFRFIVSPDDAERLADLRSYTRELMAQAEQDLGTRLDWIAIDHWNTGHPHLHVLVRGRDQEGADLVISRDYISRGLRARAGELVRLELGPRSELEVAEQLTRQAEAQRWTDLDRGLARLSGEEGLIDLRPARGARGDRLHQAQVARMRRLEAMGLARPAGVGRWRLEPSAQTTLEAMGREGDVIARLHSAMRGVGRALDPADFTLGSTAVVGRLAGRGHDDELAGSAFAVVEGTDGRLHHIALQDLADASDAPVGAVVELRSLERGRRVLAVRSDVDLAGQIDADGATWLDRRLLDRTADPPAERGFGQDVQAALAARTEHLIGEGLARRRNGQVVFARDLLATLRGRELDAAAARVAAETAKPHTPSAPGDVVEGVYRRRLDLASGRFAVIEGALGFQLVPWRRDLDERLGREVIATMGEGGRVDWPPARRPQLQI